MIIVLVALVIVLGMLSAFWLGYKAGAKEPLKKDSYPELVDLDEEYEKEISIDKLMEDDED